MKVLSKFSFFICLFLLTVSAIAQNPEVERISQLDEHMKSRPQEKLFIHLDKPFYSINDDIWFKAYLVDAVNHKPRKESMVFVELINKEDEVVASRNVQIIDGGGFGDFNLKKLSLEAGNYTLRGYTTYMRNFDDEFFFYQKIEILGLEKIDKRVEQPKKDALKIDFFPEGGELVAGTMNFLAFKASGSYLSTDQLSGTIVTAEGEEIAKLKVEKFGLGLIPLKLNNYQPLKAKIKYNGQLLEFPLPHVLPAGYTLSVRSTGSNLVLVADHTQKGKMKNAFVLVHQRGKLISTISSNEATAIQKTLKINQLPAGILTFTSFDGKGVPQRERIVFVENDGQSMQSAVLKTDRQKYKLREKVLMNIDLTSTANVTGTGSLSITNLGTIPANSRNRHLLSYLLLSSDIKGQIENPAYYFGRNNKDRFKQLDLLMMTQGWRRFTWRQIMSEGDSPFKHSIQSGVTVQGRLLDYYDHETPVQGQVKMLITEVPGFFETVETDEEGYFFFPDLAIGDTCNIILQPNRVSRKGKTVTNNSGIHIEFDEAELHPVSTTEFPKVAFEAVSKKDELEEFVKVSKKISAANAAFDLEGALILDEFKVDAQRTTLVDIKNPFRISDILYGRPTERVMMDSVYKKTPVIRPFDALRSVPGMFVSGRNVRMRGESPKYVLDGVFTSPVVINSLPVSMISHIDIFKGPDGIIFGPDGANGVIAFFTKETGSAEGLQKNGGIANFQLAGYSIGREFYTPDYSEKSDDHKKPDYRTTLYWNPEIDFSAENQLEFYTSDDKGIYLIHMEGITSEGKIVLEEQIIEVK
ncbi:MAG: TonB-dependent receptor [Bacteroidota bacterium]